MTEETQTDGKKPMPNRELFKNWMEQNKRTVCKFADEAGVPRNVIQHFITDDRHGDFNPRKMSPEYRKRIYEKTRLDIFKTTPQLIAGERADISKLYAWQQDLLNWMADNNYNQAMLQKAAGLGQGNVAFYCTQPALLDKILRKNKEAIYKLTRIESLRGNGMTSCYTPGTPAASQQTQSGSAPAPAPSNGSIDALVTEVKRLTEAVMDKLPTATRPETEAELVKRTVALYSVFVQTLEHYKTRQGAVEQLKEALPAPHAGYLMSCLNALYSKDAFNKWILQQPMPLEVRK